MKLDTPNLASDAPAHLKKELDTILALQADIDNTDRAIQAAKIAMEKHDISDDTLEALQSLQHTHDRLMSKVDILYASLNVLWLSTPNSVTARYA